MKETNQREPSDHRRYTCIPGWICFVLNNKKESPQSAPPDVCRYKFLTWQICLVVSHIKESYKRESYKRVVQKRYTNESYVRTFRTIKEPYEKTYTNHIKEIYKTEKGAGTRAVHPL